VEAWLKTVSRPPFFWGGFYALILPFCAFENKGSGGKRTAAETAAALPAGVSGGAGCFNRSRIGICLFCAPGGAGAISRVLLPFIYGAGCCGRPLPLPQSAAAWGGEAVMNRFAAVWAGIEAFARRGLGAAERRAVGLPVLSRR